MNARPLIAALISAGGTTMVFAMLLSMNDETMAPEPRGESAPVSMDVAPKPKPPKQTPKPQQRPKKTPNRPAAPPPPMPMLGGLTAVSLGLPPTDTSFDPAGAAALLDHAKSAVMTEDSVDAKPRPTRRSAANYPPRARAEGTTGFVTLSLLISERGTVDRIKILRSEPSGVFDQAATDAVRSWQFEPATYGGEPVKVWANQTVRFELK